MTDEPLRFDIRRRRAPALGDWLTDEQYQEAIQFAKTYSGPSRYGKSVREQMLARGLDILPHKQATVMLQMKRREQP